MSTLTVNYTTDPSATGGYRVRYRKVGSTDPLIEETTTANPYVKTGLTAVGYEGDISSICGSGLYSTSASFSGCSPISCSTGASDVYTGTTTYTYPKILLDLSSYSTGATYTSSASATGSTTTIAVASTTGLVAGMFIEVSSGTGAFSSGTYVTAVTTGQFTVSAAPTTALSNAVVKAYTNRIELAFNTYSTYANTSNGTRPASWIMYKNGSQVASQSYVGVMPGSGSWGSVLNNAGPVYSYGLTNYNYGNSIYTSAAGATSSGTTITVASVTGLVVGMIVKVSAGTGVFATLTRITSINTGANTFVVNKTPTTALSGGSTIVKAYDAYEIEVTCAEAVTANPTSCSWTLSVNCANTASAPAPSGTTYYALSRCPNTGTVYFTDTVLSNSGQRVIKDSSIYYVYTPQNNAVNQSSPPANYISSVVILSGQFGCP